MRFGGRRLGEPAGQGRAEQRRWVDDDHHAADQDHHADRTARVWRHP
jgi:hypothetical protein